MACSARGEGEDSPHRLKLAMLSVEHATVNLIRYDSNSIGNLLDKRERSLCVVHPSGMDWVYVAVRLVNL